MAYGVSPGAVSVASSAGVSAGGAGSVVVGGALPFVVSVSAHPATTNAAQTNINANKLLIAKSPEMKW
jgi:hypothetical protein